MKTRTILGMSLAAVMVIAIVPAFAFASYYDINTAEVREKHHPRVKDMGLKLEANVDAPIPTDGSDLLGYGVLTGGFLVVTTSHSGVLDSITQSGASDPIWHNHYVSLGGDTDCPVSPIGDLQLNVTDLTWETPGNTKIDGSEVKLTAIKTGVPSGVWHSGAGGAEGAVIAVDTGEISGTFVSFQLAGGPNSEICVIVNDAVAATD